MKRVIFLLTSIILSLINSANGQYGPGGVGNSTGTNSQPILGVWFAADSLSLTDNASVDQWPDLSKNNRHAEQPATSYRPTYKTNQINGKPMVRFDGVDDFLPFNGNPAVANKDYTVIFVGARRSDAAMQIFMGGTTMANNQNLHLYWANNTQFRAHQFGNDLQTNMQTVPPTNGGTNANTYGIFTTLLQSSASSNHRRNYQNNILLGSLSNNTRLSSWYGSAIARYGTNYYPVNAAEVIIYSSALNDAQLQIVHQYLNIKYNISIQNNLYTPNSQYVHHMAGIGRRNNQEHSLTQSAGLYLAKNGTLSNDQYVFVSNNNATNNSYTFRAEPEIIAAGAQKAFNREWQIKKVGTPNVKISFNLTEALTDGKYPGNASGYVLLYRSTPSGNYNKVKNADAIENNSYIVFNLTNAQLLDGFYTLGTEDNLNSPLQGRSGKKWYPLISGNWDSWETWTLDPSGMLPDNPDMQTPTTSPTAAIDEVIILSGKIVTIQPGNNNKNNVRLVVNGELDFTTTTGHNFTKIEGNGKIYLYGDNFPSGDATNFTSKDLGEGTVIFKGTSRNLTNSYSWYTFYNVQIDLNNANETLVLLRNLQINGSLLINKGKLQINDNSPVIRNVVVENDLTIEPQGAITVGIGNTIGSLSIPSNMPSDPETYHDIFHQFTVRGDIINKGTIRLTNQNAPVYNQFTNTGAATLRLEGSSDNSFLCFGTTDLYNLIIDKGSDKTYVVTLYADAANKFRLFGPNNVGRYESGNYSTANPLVRKALFIKNGTLKITGKIKIPTLSEGYQVSGNGDYAIGQNARLWIAGVDVEVYSTASSVDQIYGFTGSDPFPAQGVNAGSSHQALSVYGEFVISEGFFGTRNSAGFIFWSATNAQIKVEGGTVNTAQVRSAHSGSGNASYTQTGGTMIVRGDATEPGEVTNAYPIFGFDTSDGVFNMSGGEIIFYDRTGTNTNGFYIPSAEGNHNVTGGKITIEIDPGNDFEIGSTAPIYNLHIKRRGTTGTATVRLTNNLKVLGLLIIDENTIFDVRDDFDNSIKNLTVEGAFNLRIGGTFEARTGTVYFTGTTTNINIYNTTAPTPLQFHNVVIDKSSMTDPTQYYNVRIVGFTRPSSNPAVQINGNLFIDRGALNVQNWKVNLKGNLTINDGAIKANSNGRLVLNGTSQQAIEGSISGKTELGRLEINNASGILLNSGIRTTSIDLISGIVNMGTYNVFCSGDITGAPFSNTKMFRTAGNISDGSLSRQIDFGSLNIGAQVLFPVGVGTRYTPAIVTKADNNYNLINTITVKLDDANHPATNNPSQTIPFYWRVYLANTSGVPHSSLQYTFIYYQTISPSINKGSVLFENEWYEYNSVVSGTTITFPASAYAWGDYTVGNRSVFNKPRVLYSRGPQGFKNWSDKNTWSLTGHTGAPLGGGDPIPQPYDVVVIGFDPNVSNGYHWILMDVNNVRVAKVQFSGDGSTWNPRIYVEPTQTQNFTEITGRGDLILRVTPTSQPVVNADLGEFLNGEFNTLAYHIMADGNVTVNNTIGEYPNLRIEAQAATLGNRTIRFTNDLEVKRHLTVDGNSTLILNNGTRGNITVFGNLYIGNWYAGRIQFPTNNAVRTLTVHGNVVSYSDANNRFEVLNTTPSNLRHRLRLGGNLDHRTGVIDFFTNNSGGNNVILELIGADDANYTRTGGSVPEFFRIEVNKDYNKAFSFNSSFTLNGPTNSSPKALEIKDGRIILNNPGIDITLSSGNQNFHIPQKTELSVRNGAKARISGDNTGLWLDGKLSASGNGQLLFDGGTNNYIEYTTSGWSEINLEESILRVSGQIRRSTTTEEGILTFYQNHPNAVVEIGTKAIPNNFRGVFEIRNAQSAFMQTTGSTIIIANSPDNANIPALYFDPSYTEIGNNTTFQIGSSNTLGGRIMGIYAPVGINNLVVNNTSGNSPTAKMLIGSLSVNQNLTIHAGTLFDANGYTLTIKGDLENYGQFKASGNTTRFEGESVQSIKGNGTTFYNLYKSDNSNLMLHSNVTITNLFEMNGGEIYDQGYTLSGKGNFYFTGTHVHGGSGDGIELAGTRLQYIKTGGTYGKLTVNNLRGVEVISGLGNSLTITDQLNLKYGILDIDRFLLRVMENATIESLNGFAPNCMIQTNISFTDNGIKKYFPAINTPTSFTYPIGSDLKYTPIILSISTMNAGGNIRAKAANERHPSILDDDDECNQFDDTKNVLQYHWTMDAENVSNFTGTAEMIYYPADAKVDNTHGYTLSNYIAARVLTFGDGTWNKFGTENVDFPNHKLVFQFTSTDDDGISGDYTAGIEQEIGCNGAIPNQITQFISLNNGLFTDKNNWAIINPNDNSVGAPGDGVPASGPKGAIIIIDTNDTVTIPSNYVSVYKTIVRGRINIGTTFGHRFGLVTGTGTIYVERGDLPAGVYEQFFGPNGGTLEFGGNTDYPILAGIDYVHNLKFSGTNNINFPNHNITIFGNLIVNGAIVGNTNSSSIFVSGNIIRNSGKFNFGAPSGNSTIVLNGTGNQSIIGDLNTNGQGFKKLKIDKNSGSVTISGTTMVRNQLQLTKGKIFTTDANRLVLDTLATFAGGNSLSFVVGPLFKYIGSYTTSPFPVGKGTWYRPLSIVSPTHPALWKVEYFPHNPYLEFNTGLVGVSGLDLWEVSDVNDIHPQAYISLGWGPETNVGPGGLSELRVAYLDANSKWESVGGSSPTGNESSGTITSASRVSFSTKTFTIATSSPINPLPVTLVDFTATVENQKVKLHWITASEKNNNYFIVERSKDGIVFTEVTRVLSYGDSNTLQYYTTYDFEPFGGISYYRLTQVDFDGQSETFKLVSVEIKKNIAVKPSLTVYPNPYQSGEITVEIMGMLENQQILVSLADIQGKIIKQQFVINNSQEIQNFVQSEISVLPNGVYFLIVVSDNGEKVHTKLIKL